MLRLLGNTDTEKQTLRRFPAQSITCSPPVHQCAASGQAVGMQLQKQGSPPRSCHSQQSLLAFAAPPGSPAVESQRVSWHNTIMLTAS